MKTIKFIALGMLLLAAIPNQAQVSVNLNLGTPSWGPTVTTEEYYYLPDVNSYYDIRTSQFIYYNNGGWIRSKQLAPRYRGYNLNGGNIVVLNDYHGHNPYTFYKVHKVKYKKGPGYESRPYGKGGPKGHGPKEKKGKH